MAERNSGKTRRRSTAGKGPRASAAASGPTSISSRLTTPASSALPSAYTSDAELAMADSIASLTSNIGALTVHVPLSNKPPKRKRPPPFRFFDLPSELRLKVYEFYFADVGDVLDLDHDNHKRIHKKLIIFKTCRLVYREASYVFYGSRAVRIFPIWGKFFKTKKPLLARMSANQRASLTTLELRLGPGWNRPPRGWVVNDALGLKGCVNTRRIKVFVEFDPSNDIFKGFRRSDGFYEQFSKDLLEGVLKEMPWCRTVEFDANPSVKKNGAMMLALLEAVHAMDCKLAWGPEKGWDDGDEIIPPEVIPSNEPIGTFADMLSGHPVDADADADLVVQTHGYDPNIHITVFA
ncbi:hypothetical protein BKA67DRAFT_537533 [Truncatella angustata]|uniref:Uncharacterized protein n=1 Tax=Truncatella angustata TaxID=152316 RepID=A0A9P8UGL2_9PEZI|nr:uncharacterized protein BKA67DRAFT_537533 [Truncatella angustata]KAH6651672.1 hypothetical protein BKA67DRAFT_537533 [Truncatella angustata]